MFEITAFTLFALLIGSIGLTYFLTEKYVVSSLLKDRQEYTAFMIESLVAAGYIRSTRIEVAPGVWGHSILRWNATSKEIERLKLTMQRDASRFESIINQIANREDNSENKE